MSESKIERLVSMINQIALNMSANGDDQMVADGLTGSDLRK